MTVPDERCDSGPYVIYVWLGWGHQQQHLYGAYEHVARAIVQEGRGRERKLLHGGLVRTIVVVVVSQPCFFLLLLAMQISCKKEDEKRRREIRQSMDGRMCQLMGIFSRYDEIKKTEKKWQKPPSHFLTAYLPWAFNSRLIKSVFVQSLIMISCQDLVLGL